MLVSNISLAQTKVRGYVILIAGLLFGSVIFLLTLSPRGFTIIPALYLLVYSIPLILIETGIYLIDQSKKMRITDIKTKSKIDTFTREAGRLHFIYRDVKGVIALIVVFGIFFATLIPFLSKDGFHATQYFWYSIAFFLVYIIFLRRLSIFIYKESKGTKFYFLTNWGFWAGLAFFFIGWYMIYAFFYKSELLYTGLKKYLTPFGGIAFILASLYVLKWVTGKGMKYEWKGNTLVFFIPHMRKGKEIKIKAEEIKEFKILTVAEATALEDSLDLQLNFRYQCMKDFRAFSMGEIPRPRWYSANFGRDIVYLKGNDFVYFMGVADPDVLIKKIRKFKTS